MDSCEYIGFNEERIKYNRYAFKFMQEKLDIFEFKNRPWLFIIIIPFFFILFLFWFGLFVLVISEHLDYVIIPFILFFFSLRLLSILISKFRFKPNGQLTFSLTGIAIRENDSFYNLNWEKVKNIKLEYAGDRFWKSRIGLHQKLKGYNRYHSTQWYGKKKDHMILDRITINDKLYFVKIRNLKEKESFYKLKDISEKKDINIELVETDNSANIFGYKIA